MPTTDMATLDDPTPSRLRHDCRRMSLWAGPASGLLAALLALEAFGPWLAARPDGATVAAGLVDAVAPAAFLVGLWRLGVAFGRFAESGRFAAALADGLRAVGLVLVLGGLFQTFAAPGLKIVAGRGPGYYVGLDAAAIVIAALGAALLVIARLLRRAAALEAELDTIL